MTGVFISTFMRNKKGSKAEKKVWEIVKSAFSSRNAIAYLNYPIFSKDHTYRHEPDILLVDKELGATIIEVKGITIDNITGVHGHQWVYQDFYIEEGNPYQQAENQMDHLMDWVQVNGIPKDSVTKRVLVALPYIKKSEWITRGFTQLPSSPRILFQEDMNDDCLMKKIKSTSLSRANETLTDQEWKKLVTTIHGGELPWEQELVEGPKYSLLYIASSRKQFINDLRLLRRQVEKGSKVIVLAGFEEEAEWFPDKRYKPFKDIFLLQYFQSNQAYQLDDPIFITDGKDIDEDFEKEWLDRFSKFNKGQYLTEHAPIDSNLAISAGAGTGKTTVMIQRIMFMLAMEPELTLKDIVMITFTRDSAQEMKRELKDELIDRYSVTRNSSYLTHAEELREMNVSTIDSFAKTLIQELGFSLGLGRNVRLRGFRIKRREIIDESLHEYVDAKSLEELGLTEIPHYELMKIIESYWDEMESKGLSEKEIMDLTWGEGNHPEDVNAKLNNLFQHVIRTSEKKFNRIKLQENAITIGDFVRQLNRITEENSNVLRELPFHIHTLFVDEFQDSDDVQIKLVAQLHKMLDVNLFVVGDIKQSIYRFRGADYTAFRQIKKEIRPKEFRDILPLSINYRTSKTLLTEVDRYFNKWAEDELLNYDFSLDGDELSTYGDAEFAVNEYDKWANDLRDRVVEEVRDAQARIKRQSHQSKKKKIALLVRTNNQAKKLYRWLDEAKIIAEMNVGGSFYNTDAVKDFYSLLSALLFPNDTKYVLNALTTPFFETEVFLQDLVEFHGDNEKILEFLRRKHKLKPLFDIHVKELRTKPVFAVLRYFLKRDIKSNIYSKKISQLNREPTNEEMQKVKFEAVKYEKNLNHLMNLLHQQFDSTSASLYSLYTWLGINIKTNRDEDEPRVEDTNSEDVVEIITVHKSKGLEYHTIIMPLTDQPFDYDWDEILFDEAKREVGWYMKKGPHYNTLYESLNDYESEEIVKEETRLLYVAMTRARERLILFQPKKSIDETWSKLLDIDM